MNILPAAASGCTFTRHSHDSGLSSGSNIACTHAHGACPGRCRCTKGHVHAAELSPSCVIAGIQPHRLDVTDSIRQGQDIERGIAQVVNIASIAKVAVDEVGRGLIVPSAANGARPNTHFWSAYLRNAGRISSRVARSTYYSACPIAAHAACRLRVHACMVSTPEL